MTTDLKAGPALDALIAEEVMGWKRETDERELARLNLRYLDPTEYARWWINPNGSWACASPAYSSSIAAAFEMEEEIERRGLEYRYTSELEKVVIENLAGTRPNCIWSMWFVAHATPEQRCLAALETVRKK